MSSTARPRERESTASPLTAFAVVWATATLIHLVSFHFWARTWQGWTLVLCVGLVLTRPRSLPRFTAMAAASLANLYRTLPFVPNHIFFEGIVNLTILTATLWTVWRQRTTWQANWLRVRGQSLFVPLLAVVGYQALLILTEQEHVGITATTLMFYFLHRRSVTALPTQLSEKAYRSFAGVLRWELTAMYAWAVVQKLNHDYFDPAVSCAVQMQRDLENLLGLPPISTWAAPAIMAGSLLIETSIPLLLMFRRTRRIGFCVALAFHFMLALHPQPGVYSFSALVFAMLFVFLPPPAIERLRELWDRQRAALSERLKRTMDAAFLGSAVMALLGCMLTASSIVYLVMGESLQSFRVVYRFGLAAFLAWGIWLGGGYLRCGMSRSTDEDCPPRSPFSPAWACLLLVLLNGVCPWVGLKTQTAFAMFSNLRTEFEPNHFFLRRIDVFPYQREMVEVVDSDPDLFATPKTPTGILPFANQGRIIPFFELRRLLTRVEGDVSVTIRRRGSETTEIVSRADGVVNNKAAFAPPRLIERKFLWFRRHESWTGPMPFTH